jgi:ATP synthase protein I
MAVDPQDSFNKRLQSARDRAGLDRSAETEAGADTKSDQNAYGLAMRMGVELVAALAIAVAIGYGLDRVFHTKPWLMIAFMPIGLAAGLRNLIRAMGPGSK